jgi:monofunctional glycosyltransferase
MKGKVKISKLLLLGLMAIGLWLIGSIAWDLSHLPQVDDLKHANPTTTALMEQRQSQAHGRTLHPYQVFVPYGAISPHLKHAVLIAEDAGFFSHHGVDFDEMKEAIKTDWEKKRWSRGASTLTMQLAKNLYLSASKSLTRKIAEFFIAQRLESVLSKTRIFELYLNYIEWGNNLYGCEAASRAFFKTSAAELTPEQAIRLAAIIINPRRYNPYSDTRRINNRRRMLAERLHAAGYLSDAEYQALPFGQ